MFIRMSNFLIRNVLKAFLARTFVKPICTTVRLRGTFLYEISLCATYHCSRGAFLQACLSAFRYRFQDCFIASFNNL